jgi:hypothetical protein
MSPRFSDKLKCLFKEALVAPLVMPANPLATFASEANNKKLEGTKGVVSSN